MQTVSNSDIIMTIKAIETMIKELEVIYQKRERWRKMGET